MSSEIFSQCRLCLQQSNKVRSLFSDNLVQMVENLANIKLVNDERLPSDCCVWCLHAVESACKLVEQILKSDAILTLRLQENAAKSEKKRKGSRKRKSEDDDSKKINLNSEMFEIIEITNDSNKTEDVHGAASPNLEKDIKQHIIKKEFLECEQCDLKFEDSKRFHAHSSKHKLCTCTICGMSIRSDNFKRHVELHSAGTEICEICGKTAKNKESLRGHMFYQHRDKAATYKCEYCGHVFKYRYKYNLHIRKMHTGERDHQCEVCGKKFFTASDTKKHIDMTHLKHRPYTCSYCCKGFSSRYALKIHIRQHTQETPFRCDICAAGFRQKVSLKTHLKSKHDIIMVEEIKKDVEEPVTVETEITKIENEVVIKTTLKEEY